MELVPPVGNADIDGGLFSESDCAAGCTAATAAAGAAAPGAAPGAAEPAVIVTKAERNAAAARPAPQRTSTHCQSNPVFAPWPPSAFAW